MSESEINAQNIYSKMDECKELLKQAQFELFDQFYPQIHRFSISPAKRAPKPENFEKKCTEFENELKAGLIDAISQVATFDDYKLILHSLSTIINNHHQFWDIIHTSAPQKLKVTLRQTQEISVVYFQPTMLFEYGFQAFSESPICSFSNLQNDEAIIDIFYAIAGFIRACNLDASYQSNLPEYIEFIGRMVTAFVDFHDFDAYRLVWLVEAISGNLHLKSKDFAAICTQLIEKIGPGSTKNHLFKLCILSTSSVLKGIPILAHNIDECFVSVIHEQRNFLRKYIITSFTDIDWINGNPHELTEPFRAWRLMLTSTKNKLMEKPELPNLLMVDFLDDSLSLFIGIYGEVQPSRLRSMAFRMDIFAIVELVQQFYDRDLPQDTLTRIWYLLYIAAISGASEADLKDLEMSEAKDPNAVFLGLDRSVTDFMNYRQALGKLSKKFETEFDTFPRMCEFIRQNYPPESSR